MRLMTVFKEFDFFSMSIKFTVDLQRDYKINWDQIFICIGDLHFI